MWGLTRGIRFRFLGLILVVGLFHSVSGRAEQTAEFPAAPTVDQPPDVFLGEGVRDEFGGVREAIAAAKAGSDRDYRVVVVKNGTGAAALLRQLVQRWREAGDDSGFNPAADVTIVLDTGDRSLAMDVPWSVETTAGLDQATLERDLISKLFVPRAKDGLYADGLADLVRGTEQWIEDRRSAAARRAAAAHTFRTRTLPYGAAALAGLGFLGWLLVRWTRHVRRLREAREKLAAFKADVVALSDLLDTQRERHRMLPHADPDFLTPMQGMTRDTYDAVQDAIGRYRERWLGLMDVWERAQERLASERFLGTQASSDVIHMLDAAEARPPLDEVAAACRAPLDALEGAHERARELATELNEALAAARQRLDRLAARGRSTASLEPAIVAASRDRDLAAADVERDPVAARGRFEEARATLETLADQAAEIETVDHRRERAIERCEEIRRRVADRRAEGWLLAEPGAEPEPMLATALRETDLAARLLDDGQADSAVTHVEKAETAIAEVATLLENVAAARGRTAELLPAVAARLEAIAADRPAAESHRQHLETTYAAAAWRDVADNLAKAEEGLVRARTLLLEGQAAADATRQHYFRAVAVLEEAARQEDWAATCLAGITDRREELDDLRASLPGAFAAARDRVETLARRLERQRTDRPRAHERLREAERLLELAASLLREAQPDPHKAMQVVQAADLAAARGDELADEDERLARQAAEDIDEADATLRRVAAWYAEGLQADVRSARGKLDAARGEFSRQRYEAAIQAAAEASQQARVAYATATAEAERRRIRRQQEIRRRQLEESFARTSRGAGPWVINLPGGTFTGPTPWRSLGGPSRPSGGGSGPAVGNWSDGVAEVRW
ncbi:MAG: Chromosome partition protein Smc [Planctomycetota bacterium]